MDSDITKPVGNIDCQARRPDKHSALLNTKLPVSADWLSRTLATRRCPLDGEQNGRDVSTQRAVYRKSLAVRIYTVWNWVPLSKRHGEAYPLNVASVGGGGVVN